MFGYSEVQKYENKCDPLCENPAKVPFLRLTIFCIKSSYIL